MNINSIDKTTPPTTEELQLAKSYCDKIGKYSICELQRHFTIGYIKARKIMDLIEPTPSSIKDSK